MVSKTDLSVAPRALWPHDCDRPRCYNRTMISVVLLAATDAESLSDALAQLSRLGLESLLLPVLCQIVVIVIAARVSLCCFVGSGSPA